MYKLIKNCFSKYKIFTTSVKQSENKAISTEDLIDFSQTIPLHKFIAKTVQFYETTTGNYFLPNDTSNDLISHIKENKICDAEIVDLAKEYITPGSTVLDIGSNLGQMAILFSKMTGPSGQVFAFEADDFIFYLLQKNIAANNGHNIRAFFRETFAPTLSIDELHIQTPISFMKVNVPGNNIFVLKGAIKTIATHQMPIFLKHEEQFPEDFLHSISYKIIKVINQIYYLIAPVAKSVFIQHNQPSLCLVSAPFQNKLCKFLKNKNEIDDCTLYLHRNGFLSHNLTCKDWDIAHIIPEINEGNLLDMGSCDSYILKNLSLHKIQGEKYGIDLNKPDIPIPDVKYLIGDLMNTGLPNQYFKNITCLSVIEHQVNFAQFAAEVSRLLAPGGRLFVTFDYWEPKVISPIKLYDLTWQPLDRQTLEQFISICNKNHLNLVQDFDWDLGDPVITWGYYAPHPLVSYTFGMCVFEKIL